MEHSFTGMYIPSEQRAMSPTHCMGVVFSFQPNSGRSKPQYPT